MKFNLFRKLLSRDVTASPAEASEMGLGLGPGLYLGEAYFVTHRERLPSQLVRGLWAAFHLWRGLCTLGGGLLVQELYLLP